MRCHVFRIWVKQNVHFRGKSLRLRSWTVRWVPGTPPGNSLTVPVPPFWDCWCVRRGNQCDKAESGIFVIEKLPQIFGCDFLRLFVFGEHLLFSDILLHNAELFDEWFIGDTGVLEVFDHAALLLEFIIKFVEFLDGQNLQLFFCLHFSLFWFKTIIIILDYYSRKLEKYTIVFSFLTILLDPF